MTNTHIVNTYQTLYLYYNDVYRGLWYSFGFHIYDLDCFLIFSMKYFTFFKTKMSR